MNRFKEIYNNELLKDTVYVERYLEYLEGKALTDYTNRDKYNEMITKVRAKNKISYEEIAFITNLNKSTTFRWSYSGDSYFPSAEELYILSQAFKVPSDYLLGLAKSTNTELANEINVFEKYGFSADSVKALYDIRQNAYELANTDAAVGVVKYDYMMSGLHYLLSQQGDPKNYNLPPILYHIGYLLGKQHSTRNFHFDDDDFENLTEQMKGKENIPLQEVLDNLDFFLNEQCYEVPSESYIDNLLNTIKMLLGNYYTEVSQRRKSADAEPADETIKEE